MEWTRVMVKAATTARALIPAPDRDIQQSPIDS
jgi:hypothetical protein